MEEKKSKLWLIITVIVCLVLSLACGLYIIVKSKLNLVNFKVLDNSDLGIEISNEDVPQVNVEDVTKFVIFGSDSRDENNQYYGRSDTIIIVVIDNVKKSISLISIPRDTYVNVPGYGMTKINHAYAYGQEQLSIKTINSNFGLDLTQYMTIDFSGLVNAIDTIGGVDVNLTQEEIDYINARMDANNKITETAGRVKLNGKQALVHSRNRTIGNDFTRASRQRQILVAILDKVRKMSINDILPLIDKILPNLTTNMNITIYKDALTKLFINKDEYVKNITSVQIPSTEYGYDRMIDGIYYFACDMDRAKQDFQKYYFGKEE